MRTLICARALPVCALVACLFACSPPAPRFVQVDAPNDTRDGAGTYRVTALLRGVTDDVVAITRVGDAEGVTTALVDQGDGRFVAELVGVRPGSRISLSLRADGPGGSADWPPGEPWTFRVLDASGVCLVDGDCLGGEMCDRLAERCVERDLTCADAGDCPLDYECDVERGECRFRRSTCEDDAECGRGRICEDGLCVARPECLDDSECPDGSTCLTPPGRCVGDAVCRVDIDCPVGQRCIDNRCVADGCDGPCPEGTECVDGACVDITACGECPPTAFCSPILGACVECTADGHCGPGRTCVDTRCVDGPRGAPCTPCGEDGACGVGYGCNFDFGGICSPTCEGGCPTGTVCDGGLCRSEVLCGGEDCRFDDDCEGPCLAGVCDPPQLCVGARDCADGWGCVDGVCLPDAPACNNPFDCGPSEVCIGGRCRATDVLGECRPCEVPTDCPSPALCADVDGSGARCLPLCGVDGCAEGLECFDAVHVGICLPQAGRCQAGACGADQFEDGPVPFPIPPDQPLRAFVCNQDVDEYAMPGAGTIEVFAEGPLTVEVIDPVIGRTLVRRSLSPGEVFNFDVSDRPSQLRVSTSSPEDVGYVFELQTRGAPPMCDDDILEENDSQRAATVIGDGADINPRACPGDDDWFRIRLEPGQQASVIVGVVERVEAALVYQVRTESGAVLREGSINEGAAQVEVRGTDEATFLRVTCPECEAGVRYTVQTRFGGGEACPADRFEPNNDLDSPAAVMVPIDADLTVCEGDDDYLRFRVPARQRWRVDLEFEHAAGDIDAVLFEGGDEVEAATSGTDNERLNVPISRRDRTYTLRVYLFPGDPLNTYRLRIRQQ